MAEQWQNMKEKGEKFVSDMDKNPHVKEVKEHIKKNPKEFFFAAGILLGLLLSGYWFGSLLIGIGAGLFAPWSIRDLINRGKSWWNENKLVAIAVGLVGIYLLLHVFWFVIGFTATLVVRALFPKGSAA